MQRTNKNYVLLVPIFIISATYFIYEFYADNRFRMKIEGMPSILSEHEKKRAEIHHKYTMIDGSKMKNNSTVHVLFWGDFIGNSPWGHAEETIDQNYLSERHCPETDCILTHKVNYLENVFEFDAVIINVFNKELTVPKLRSTHQLYIMSANE